MLSLQPANGDVLDTDLPLLSVAYRDAGVGVELASLHIMLNGYEVTDRFALGDGEATWQVGIDDYLEEGLNELSVTLSDRMGNAASATSIFLVATPTDVLLAELTHDDWRYRRRAAYKLLYRPDEITLSQQRRCLKQLAETPEPKAVERLKYLAGSSDDEPSRALAAAALGEVARVAPALGQRPDVQAVLCGKLFDDESFLVKAAAARALGLLQSQPALDCLDDYLENVPHKPSPPAICTEQPGAADCLQYQTAFYGVKMQVTRAAIRIAGEEHAVANPGTMGQALQEYLARLQELLDHLEQQ